MQCTKQILQFKYLYIIPKQFKLTSEFLLCKKLLWCFSKWSYHPPNHILKNLHKCFCYHSSERLIARDTKYALIQRVPHSEELCYVPIRLLKIKNLPINYLNQELHSILHKNKAFLI